MTAPQHERSTQERFLEIIRGQLAGLRDKVEHALSEETFTKELRSLEGDPVYSNLGFASPEYALVRLVGRISISIGRRLGELYDKFPRFVAAARFGIPVDEISPKVGALLLDIAIPRERLSIADLRHVENELKARGLRLGARGVGIEVRYNFNPNDSARLRKDDTMAANLRHSGYTPIYLVFSSISPREEAMKRLSRAGWFLITGAEARAFANDLFQLNIEAIMAEPSVDAEIRRDVAALMSQLASSYAFRAVTKPDVKT